MIDQYLNFAELSQHERAEIDYRIDVRDGLECTAIIAPHGGKIEPGTSEIARAIAADTYGLYCFEGLKTKGNNRLHITSTRFDEPRCLDFVAHYDQIVSVHGCKGNDHRIYLGGEDEQLRREIEAQLQGAGIATGFHSNPCLQGINPNNICNKGRQRRGVQLEITKGFRIFLCDSAVRLKEAAGTIREAIQTGQRRFLER